MVSSGKNQEDEEKKSANFSRGGGLTRSWGTFSGQSMSTSGSVGSPSSRSESVMATPVASDNAFVRLNHLHIQGDDVGSQSAVGGKKKKRGQQRPVGGDKSGRGLRQFSIKVCEKVESKGRTTYNEVADELVAEFTDPSNSLASPDQQQYDEKNIRRRVYDALNVLMAMDIISKDKKDIQWKGLPHTGLNDIEELKAEHLGLRNRVEKKASYLKELEEQFIGLQNLIQRNEQLYDSGNAPKGGVALPFILVQSLIPKIWGQLSIPLYLESRLLSSCPATIRQYSMEMYYPKDLVSAINSTLSRVTSSVWKCIHSFVGHINACAFFSLETRPHATVEVEISEDMQLVHFDFNSTPFELHDDNYVLKAMKLCGTPQGGDGTHDSTANGGEGSSMIGMCQTHVTHPLRSNATGRPPISSPLPGILKSRAKHEH